MKKYRYIFGVFLVVLLGIVFVRNSMITKAEEYDFIQDITQAAMVDAVDYSYYRQYQELRINREKFVENFLRRFSDRAPLDYYDIDFYDIYEVPPKVSVQVKVKNHSFSVVENSSSFDMTRRVDLMLEFFDHQK